MRKLAIVCIPVFFNPAGSPAQLIFGLMVCFVTAVLYATLQPYSGLGNMRLALIAQVQIFFSLLASISLSFSPAQYGSAAGVMDVLLTLFLIVPIALGLLVSLFALGLGSSRVKMAPKELKVHPQNIGGDDSFGAKTATGDGESFMSNCSQVTTIESAPSSAPA